MLKWNTVLAECISFSTQPGNLCLLILSQGIIQVKDGSNIWEESWTTWTCTSPVKPRKHKTLDLITHIRTHLPIILLDFSFFVVESSRWVDLELTCITSLGFDHYFFYNYNKLHSKYKFHDSVSPLWLQFNSNITIPKFPEN